MRETRRRCLIQAGVRVSVAPGYFNDANKETRYYGRVMSKIGSSLRVSWEGEGGVSSLVESDDVVIEDEIAVPINMATLCEEVLSVTGIYTYIHGRKMISRPLLGKGSIPQWLEN